MSEPVITRSPATTHPGCVRLRTERQVGKVLVVVELTTNPASQGKRDAELELLEKLEDAAAKEAWRQNA